MNVDVALDCRCQLGEGPIWDYRSARILFVDINGHRIHAYDPSSQAHESFDCGEYVSAIALAAHGGYAVTLQHDIAWFADGKIAERPLTVESGRKTRFNDGYVDPRGRFWAGTLSLVRKPEDAALYRIDLSPYPLVTRMLSRVTNSNGIDWSGDGQRMYYIDTGTRRIDVFDFDPDAGTIANRRPLVTFAEGEGKPDGLVLDEEDGIWVALWEGSAVRRYASDGRLLTQIDLPVSCPTKPAFGGANLDELYITTARTALTTDADRAREPHAGSLLVARPGVRGRRAREFRA